MGAVEQKPFGRVDDIRQVREWLPAQVPGDVRLDLLHAGRIPDPFYGTNNEESQWVDDFDWWYKRDLGLDLEKDDRCWLIFEGIDYQSAIWLDDNLLGQHTGMFSQQTYEITNAASGPPRRGKSIHLAVRVWGSGALPKMKLNRRQRFFRRLLSPIFSGWNELYPDRYATVKCQMQFGWDFAPRLRTCGIWDDVYLVTARAVFIRDVWIRGAPNVSSRTAQVQVRLTIDSDREQDVHVSATIKGLNFTIDSQVFVFDWRIEKGEQIRPLEFDLKDIHLWNPWDRGGPDLYALEIEIWSGQLSLDSYTTTFGLRTLELVPIEGAGRDAEPWSFVFNGRPEFVRGANWVPLDALPGRLTRDDYARRLKQARDAHINFLRVWGGGLREKQAFYDLCDELGILVWQEFPFAGAILDRFPQDSQFQSLVDAECAAIVRALRNHPSVAVWCGGNEFNTRGNSPIVNTLRQVTRREDGTRPFKPASPYRDESHNWRVWHRGANLRDYRKDRTPFLSEFGLQSPPHTDSLKRFMAEHDVYPAGRTWVYHRANVGRIKRYSRCPDSAPLEEFVKSSQRAQAMAMQIAIEHLRRNKPRTAGVAFWQLDDPWPTISWSVIDYYGQPKLAYAMIRRVYSPVLASFEYPLRPRGPGEVVHGELWVINDLWDTFRDVDLLISANERVVETRRVNVGRNSSTRVGSLDVILSDGGAILRLELRQREHSLSVNEYDLSFCDVGEINPLVSLGASLYNHLMR